MVTMKIAGSGFSTNPFYNIFYNAGRYIFIKEKLGLVRNRCESFVSLWPIVTHALSDFIIYFSYAKHSDANRDAVALCRGEVPLLRRPGKKGRSLGDRSAERQGARSYE